MPGARGGWTPALAEAVGSVIGRFHRAGVWHADLNAHNVLVAPDGVYLIDFDRGRLRVPAVAWQQANLQRLRAFAGQAGRGRSTGDAAFDRDLWQPLLAGYARTLNS